jgi:hypothetical protein
MARYEVKSVLPQAGAHVHRAHATNAQGEVTFDFHAQLLPIVAGDNVRFALDHSLPYACNGTVVAQTPGQLLASFGSMLMQFRPWPGDPEAQANDTIALSMQTGTKRPLEGATVVHNAPRQRTISTRLRSITESA